MPKVEVYRSILLGKIGKDLTDCELVSILEMAKAEICEFYTGNDKIKIEFNDTNRPDLWSYTGLARQIKTYLFGQLPSFEFFSTADNLQKFYGEILVSPEAFSIRPFIFGFLAKGMICNEQMLETLIQLQEKLCHNYGQKRKRVAMGMYSSASIEFPVSYVTCNSDYRFIPLGMDIEMSIKEINKRHPKGIEYASILEHFTEYPLLLDYNDKVLSYPPVINSHDIGALKVGDTDLFIEVTGTNLEATLLSLSVVACDLHDMGFEILPVKTVFPKETPFGKEIICPYYFQNTLEVSVESVNRMFGSNFTVNDMCLDLKKLGISAYFKELDKFYIIPPVYRNDFLHEVDVIEEIMIGRGLDSFKPELPKDFTLGKLSQIEEFSRKIKNLMIGMGFQEMIYNYLGSRTDFIEKMNIKSDEFLSVANPMTEGYEYVRGSIVPDLLKSESISSNFPYPHKIFEIGKVALKDLSSVDGTMTYDNLAFLMADKEFSFNEINSLVSSLFYYLNIEFKLRESSQTLYINGRGADILINDIILGSFGEVSPYILSNFGIMVPCCVLEINLNKILH
ncbi:phenylalanine--tRNA ligase subunit beta [Borrelia hermsii]|uniref:Phenylalanine--tRNA ligase beta subunit n=3 Tax=Borrelia hermsii TaxID=140 RepID=SYFB_BORHD|nr:phenylalanine--tRNA ligase subunit beta [Borrelia hermsii]B2S0L6.1 RecName: Full=Phenylalanine--tRNA ligase beta subunit; AltName: Full=Phenylalanyl-tRNA synthetase beta subunit; Short=PheRS [Borrelia hermsii DAH]AAX17022.1 phenylalanyl-tRNA synthetase beta chain [Borrelia hermsii DAH]AJW73314.1 phenylalanyl-tRNA synthetase subunit beta [Borrelia hermsii CC1]AMR75333.1 Phenylalanyl-tRNA synthetase beta chain [Borrelia hermsii]ANA43320.1 phenylalanine--tRNA ligase subunit beta [Borrelia herm